MSATIESPRPILFHIPPSLQHLAISRSQFLSENPQYTTLVVAACIFAPQHQDQHQRHPPASLPQHQDQNQRHPSVSLPQHQDQDQHLDLDQHHPTGTLPPPGDKHDKPTPAPAPAPRLLLVQRAATDAFPNLWEIPGGSSEATDLTIFHSVAREVLEETGLHLKRIVQQVGEGVEFRSKKEIVDENGVSKPKKVYFKFTFEIEVTEFENELDGLSDSSTSSHHNNGPSEIDEILPSPSESTSFGAIAAAIYPTAIALPSSLLPPPPPSFFLPPSGVITLDPSEHQRYVWVTEQEYGKTEDGSKYPTMPGQQRETILEAFKLKSRQS